MIKEEEEEAGQDVGSLEKTYQRENEVGQERSHGRKSGRNRGLDKDSPASSPTGLRGLQVEGGPLLCFKACALHWLGGELLGRPCKEGKGGHCEQPSPSTGQHQLESGAEGTDPGQASSQ